MAELSKLHPCHVLVSSPLTLCYETLVTKPLWGLATARISTSVLVFERPMLTKIYGHAIRAVIINNRVKRPLAQQLQMTRSLPRHI